MLDDGRLQKSFTRQNERAEKEKATVKKKGRSDHSCTAAFTEDTAAQQAVIRSQYAWRLLKIILRHCYITSLRDGKA
jgi:hypothetical protein